MYDLTTHALKKLKANKIFPQYKQNNYFCYHSSLGKIKFIHAMKETKFVEENKHKWEELESILKKNTPTDPERLTELYIEINDDLSYARTFYGNRSVKGYLNTLSQTMFYKIYQNKKTGLGKLVHFWQEELPQHIWNSRKAMMTAFIVFFISALIGVFSFYMDEGIGRAILGDGYVEMTIENIKKGDPMNVYKDSDEMGMFLRIALNNLQVAFMAYLLGVFLSIGTLAVTIQNGIMLGVFQYFFIRYGNENNEDFMVKWLISAIVGVVITLGGSIYFVSKDTFMGEGKYERKTLIQKRLEFLLMFAPISLLLSCVFATLIASTSTFRDSFFTIWIHGTIEIGCIVIASAAGLELGKGLLFPGAYTRLQAFQLSARRSMKIFIAIAPLIVFAAINEGFITRHTEFPNFIRGIIILLYLAFMLWYFVFNPYLKAQKGFAYPLPAESIAAVVDEPIIVEDIKDMGEIIGDTFDLFRTTLTKLILFSGVLAAIYTSIVGINLWGTLDTTFLLPGIKAFFNRPIVLFNSTFQYLYTEGITWMPVLNWITISSIALYCSYFFAYRLQNQRDTTFFKFIFQKARILTIPIALLPMMAVWYDYLDADSAQFQYWLISAPTFMVVAALSNEEPYYKGFWKGIVYTFKGFGTNLGTHLLITLLFLIFNTLLGTTLISTVMEFFSVLIPDTGNTENSVNEVLLLVSTFATIVLWGITYSLFFYSYTFLYYSHREVANAVGLKNQIAKMGTKKQIMGIDLEKKIR